MPAAKFLADRAALHAAASAALRGLVSYDEINQRITATHMKTLYAVYRTYDNGCPEDYDNYQVGLFECHDDATAVIAALIEEDRNDTDTTFSIDLVRVY